MKNNYFILKHYLILILIILMHSVAKKKKYLCDHNVRTVNIVVWFFIDDWTDTYHFR